MTDNIGKEFMKKTRHDYMPVSAQTQGVPQPPLELPLPHDKTQIQLPRPESFNFSPTDLLAIINKRRSLRRYSETPLTLVELSFLLWCTQGVKKTTARPVTFRTVPSAGARHPFETYLLLNKVEDISPGVYRFSAIEHVIYEYDLSPDIASVLTENCFDQTMVLNSAAAFIWVAVVERTTWRYPVRGYRYLHLDAGHICQNLYLAAEAINCGVCAIAAYDDEKINNTLGLDGEDQFDIYLASLGKH